MSSGAQQVIYGFLGRWASTLADTVYVRLNYILWLQDILSHTSSSEHPSPVFGIDMYLVVSWAFCLRSITSAVGRVHQPSTLSLLAASLPIGSSLPPVGHIPLLVFSLLKQMLDIDTVSLISARSNIDRNSLSERIALLRADPTGPIMLPLTQDTNASCVTHSTKSFRT
jgi:hypothetical protein